MTVGERGGRAATTTEAPARPLRWWKEALFVLIYYGVYSTVRNTQGSASVSSHHAFNNALHVIRFERAVHIFHEQTVQKWFLGWHWFIEFWNVYYGTAHFVVTIAVLIWLFRRDPARYPLWRNTLAASTGLALVGFALYPLMPPRLLPSSYRFVDTLKEIGGLWSFDSGTMQKISNQYAAMPSLHCAWSLWCAAVVWPYLHHLWSRTLAVLYPLLTIFCIVVTANHYFLDAVGGAITLATGYGIACLITRGRVTHSVQPGRPILGAAHQSGPTAAKIGP